MATKTAKTYVAPRALQKIFILSVASVFISQLGFQIYNALTLYKHSSDLSSTYWIFFFMALQPLLFFLVAYLFNSKKKLNLANLFENTLIASSGILFYTTLSLVLGQLRASFQLFNFSDGFWNWILPEIVLTGCVLLVFTAMLFWLRRTKRWR